MSGWPYFTFEYTDGTTLTMRLETEQLAAQYCLSDGDHCLDWYEVDKKGERIHASTT